jgi:hypothetical protein
VTKTATSQNEPVGTAKRLARRSLFLLLIAALLLVGLGWPAWAKGLVLGGLASAANLVVMAWLLPRAVGRSRGRAQAASLGSIGLRFGLMGAALAIALMNPAEISWIAAAAGLFTVQITIFLDRWRGALRPAPPTGSG